MQNTHCVIWISKMWQQRIRFRYVYAYATKWKWLSWTQYKSGYEFAIQTQWWKTLQNRIQIKLIRIKTHTHAGQIHAHHLHANKSFKSTTTGIHYTAPYTVHNNQQHGTSVLTNEPAISHYMLLIWISFQKNKIKGISIEKAFYFTHSSHGHRQCSLTQ